jgi:uncharacterized protein (DUF488 family)
MTDQRLTIWTVGHSTRSGEEFISVLSAHGIETLVDVRSYPGSRRYPQFNRTELARILSEAGIDYKHLPALGGRRKPKPDSINTAWQNASFRAYADHMESEEFKTGVDDLFGLAAEKRTAIMCAEAVWWSCHRSLVSDYLKVIGVEVIHIINAIKTQTHPYTAAARIVDGRLSYRGLLQ